MPAVDVVRDLVRDPIVIDGIQYDVDTQYPGNPADALVGVGKGRSLLIRAINGEQRYVLKFNLAANGTEHRYPHFHPNEIEALRHLQSDGGHESIVRFHGYGDSLLGGNSGPGSFYPVDVSCFEFVEGKDLSHHLTQRDGLVDLNVPIVVGEICEGLMYCHERGVIHRDLKPSNIVISEQGTVVVDFGISLNPNYRLKKKEGNFLGTELYATPERLCEEDEDARGDQYGVGILVYEMLAGTHPLEGWNSETMQIQIAFKGLPDLSRYVPGIEPRLEEAVHRAIALDPNERYATIREFQAEVVPLLQEHYEQQAA